jgi:hypothetical protein
MSMTSTDGSSVFENEVPTDDVDKEAPDGLEELEDCKEELRSEESEGDDEEVFDDSGELVDDDEEVSDELDELEDDVDEVSDELDELVDDVDEVSDELDELVDDDDKVSDELVDDEENFRLREVSPVTADVSWRVSSGEVVLPAAADNGGLTGGRRPDSVPLVALLGAVPVSTAEVRTVMSRGRTFSVTVGLSEPCAAVVLVGGTSPHIHGSGESESDWPRGLDMTVEVYYGKCSAIFVTNI